jgi:hypothetical protein
MDQGVNKIPYWNIGDPLTVLDMKLLKPLIEKADELGYTPSVNELKKGEAKRIKYRFRTWNHACQAAGLIWINHPIQHRLRSAARRQQKTNQMSKQKTDDG